MRSLPWLGALALLGAAALAPLAGAQAPAAGALVPLGLTGVSGDPSGVPVAGDLVYLAVHPRELHVLRFAAPTAPCRQLLPTVPHRAGRAD